jgi:hypothetical protein
MCATPLNVAQNDSTAEGVRPVFKVVNRLLEAKAIFGEVRPETFASDILENLLSEGRLATAETDFNNFGEKRKPLKATILLGDENNIQAVFDEFENNNPDLLLGYVETDNYCMVMVTADWERDLKLPNALPEISEALGGTFTVLVGDDETPEENFFADCFYTESDSIAKALREANLQTSKIAVPKVFELQEGSQCTVVKYVPNQNNVDAFVLAVIYVGSCAQQGNDIVLKSMFRFEEKVNRTVIRAENWAIELSSYDDSKMSPSEFKTVAKQFADLLEGKQFAE